MLHTFKVGLSDYSTPARVFIYRVGQKTRTCLSVDNSATVTRRKACYMSKSFEML